MSTDIQPIFLFSLPRSGSTLSQRILAAHKDIATVTEPCILLPYLYSLKDKGVYSEYGHEVTAWGIQDFCGGLPNGQDDYFEEIRALALRLYSKAAGNKAKYFVDKTPSYSFIADDIMRLFPDAKFIFLWRNPLAIVSSLLTMWHGGRWSLYRFSNHLWEGLSRLVNCFQKHSNKALTLRYEDLILNPEEEWRQVYEYLDLSYDSRGISRFKDIKLQGRLGDHIGKKYDDLNQEPLEKWKAVLANPIRKIWCRNYLRWIGQERLALIGYDLDTLLGELDHLKLSFRFAGSDLWWMPYGSAYQTFEGRLMKHKFQALTSGHRMYIHN